MSSSSKYVDISATITISGNSAPYTVDAPSVVNMRINSGTPRPARITYSLAKSSMDAGFTIGGVVIKTPCADIGLYSTSSTQLVFKDEDSIAVETFSFGFHYYHGGHSYYFDPDIENEEPK